MSGKKKFEPNERKWPALVPNVPHKLPNEGKTPALVPKDSHKLPTKKKTLIEGEKFYFVPVPGDTGGLILSPNMPGLGPGFEEYKKSALADVLFGYYKNARPGAVLTMPNGTVVKYGMAGDATATISVPGQPPFVVSRVPDGWDELVWNEGADPKDTQFKSDIAWVLRGALDTMGEVAPPTPALPVREKPWDLKTYNWMVGQYDGIIDKFDPEDGPAGWDTNEWYRINFGLGLLPGTLGVPAGIALTALDSAAKVRNGDVTWGDAVASGVGGLIGGLIGSEAGSRVGTLGGTWLGGRLGVPHGAAGGAGAGGRFGSGAGNSLGTQAGGEAGVAVKKFFQNLMDGVPAFSRGGPVSGSGGPTSDVIPAWLSNGEYVVNAAAAGQFLPLLELINSGWVPSAGFLHGTIPGFATGGAVGVPESDAGTKWNDILSQVYSASAANAGTASTDSFQFNQADLAGNALSGAISGVKSGGLVKGITGGLSSLASTAGGQIGSAIGTAVGTAIGGVGGPIGAAIGSVIGSAVASMGADMVLKPIEEVAGWAGNTAKETIGSGFGLVDLAKGPGGHTAREDIYNFNGMDPKSAAMAVERVRRRRTLAQQRGGGLGR